VHAGDDAVGGQHDVAAGRRRNDGGVIAQAERAGMLGQRPEIARDQAVFGGFWRVCHRATQPFRGSAVLLFIRR